MIHMDGIIYSWHPNGGIPVYFEEIMSYLKSIDEPSVFYSYANVGPKIINKIDSRRRIFERYRRFSPEMSAGDVFHSSYYRLPSSRQAAVVTTVHDFIYERQVSGLRRVVHSAQKNSAIVGSDAIICISESTKKDLLEIGPQIDEDRVFVIHNGVGDAFYRIDNRRPETDYALYVGARGRYKNFKSAVIAVSKVPGLFLKFVGGGSPAQSEIDYLNEYLPGRYFWCGNVTVQELNTLYNYAHVLVYPSSYEGFGIPVLEAMRAGCPVVAVNSSSLPEVSGEAALLIESADPDLIFEAIERFGNIEYREAAISRGLEWSSRFSWRRTAEETMKVYKYALENKNFLF